jgi:hypothetical protein
MSTQANAVARPIGFEALRRFAPKEIPGEHCDLCSLRIGERHQHLLEVASRQIVCACEACAILFSHQGNSRYKQIPRDSKLLADFQLSDIDWESLAIPIGLAFFFYNSDGVRSPTMREGQLASGALPDGRASDTKVSGFYPSPAGATECLLELSAWQDLARANPMLKEMQPDVEALLVNRIGTARDHYLVPIDECYKLVGLIRTHWRGLSGGQEVWARVDQFFQGLCAARMSAAGV